MIEGLLLPKGHLSWSGYICWNTNPARFVREYFENGEKLDTKYLRFGKGIAKMIENGEHKALLPDLPIYAVHELQIGGKQNPVELAGVPILSFLDGDDGSTEYFGEYKTGKIAWTQAKVQKHDQLTFYALAKRAKTGVIPKRCYLHWIETVDGQGSADDFWARVDHKVSVTGKIVTFERVFDVRELDRMEKEIVRTALEISAAYKAWIAEI